ncbi:hypothetical protein [Ideonella sp.]|uniref:hypothetical protein n=1 Tax=Ideonella sp. TaxID=1929293 RepID=UPI0035B081D4
MTRSPHPPHSPRDPTLADALARLRTDLARHPAPPLRWPAHLPVEAPEPARAPAPVGAGQAAAPAGRPGGATGWPAWVAATVLLLGCAWVLWTVPAAGPGRPAAGGDAGLVGTGPAARPQAAGTGFVPVASPERLAQLWQDGANTAPAWVVRTELPRERLAALGLPYDPARAAEPVAAELLMHPAGDVLAVRLTAD